MADPREHYVIAVKRHERAHFLLWDGDSNGVVTTPDGPSLLAFATDADARAHATTTALLLSENESAYFDFDEVSAWISAPSPYRIRPDRILNAWNLLGAVARSVGNQVAAAKLLDRRDEDLHGRLGSSGLMPALGMATTQRPSAEDCAAIAAVLRHGLACFDAALPVLSPLPAPAPR